MAMGPEKRFFLAVGFTLVTASGGFDVYHNVFPGRAQIINEQPTCSGLDIEYNDLVGRAKRIRDASKLLEHPILNPGLQQIVACGISTEEAVKAAGLEPEGLRQSLGMFGFAVSIFAGAFAVLAGIYAFGSRGVRIS